MHSSYYWLAICSVFFFFSSRRRHTRYWRDWSSDVCSSDLSRSADTVQLPRQDYAPLVVPRKARHPVAGAGPYRPTWIRTGHRRGGRGQHPGDRKSGVEGKRVNLGGRRIIKKKKRGGREVGH